MVSHTNPQLSGSHHSQKTAYLAMVRSIIEYGSNIWSPKQKNLQKDVEAIQRKGTSFILNNPRFDSPLHIDYKTRLLTLNLLPTTYRREILDITLLLKAIHGKTNLDLSNYITFADRQIGPRTRLTDNQTRLTVTKTKRDITQHFYTYRICRVWNSLPQQIRIALINTHEPLVIKQHLIPYYKHKLATTFDVDNQCTWVSVCGCGRC